MRDEVLFCRKAAQVRPIFGEHYLDRFDAVSVAGYSTEEYIRAAVFANLLLLAVWFCRRLQRKRHAKSATKVAAKAN